MGFSMIGAGTWGKKAQPVTLPGGAAFTLPSGQYLVMPGLYTYLQYFDAQAQIWRNLTSPATMAVHMVTSDGSNMRLANMTGTVQGAVVTNGGTGYTNGIYPFGTGLGTAASPTATVAAGGGSVLAGLNVIVGGAINTSVTITNAGANYTKPPVIQVSRPPAGGLPATATCTISAGAINAVTVTNQGAGYSAVPTFTVTPQQGDTTGGGAVLTGGANLLSGQIVALTCSNPGFGYTSVPAITFSPASTTAATAIMQWAATTVTWAGPNHAGNGNFGLINSTVTAGSSTSTNPLYTTGIFLPRMGYTAMSTTGSPTTTTIIDGGLHQIVPNAVLVNNSDGTINAATTTTIAQGPVADTSVLLPL